MATAKKNMAAKALQAHMAKAKRISVRAMLEWELACNTNSQRGKVYDQAELMELYGRRADDAERGASKICHLYNHNGERFKFIVIKRHRVGGYIPNAASEHEKCSGNQLIDEINCWQELAETSDSDLLCPILKYFTSKSDKVSATSDTMQRNVMIISQRAIYVGDAMDACRKAEQLNTDNGFHGEGRRERLEKLKDLSYRKGWRDAIHNCGNSGVIFDYSKNCYKAVFIDYAL